MSFKLRKFLKGDVINLTKNRYIIRERSGVLVGVPLFHDDSEEVPLELLKYGVYLGNVYKDNVDELLDL